MEVLWVTEHQSIFKPTGQQKRATCFATLLPSEWKSDVARFTTHESNLSRNKSGCLQVAWILTFDWIKFRGRHAIHGSYVTCCKTSLPWAGKTRNMFRLCCKSRTTLYFLQQIFATCNNLICCKTGLNVTTQYHFSTCFAAMLQNKLPFLLPVLSYL